MNRSRSLTHEILRNLLFSVSVFTLAIGIGWAIEMFFNIRGSVLKWDDNGFLFSLPATVFGITYILSIRNPNNFYGFLMGILMSVFLSCQFYYLGNYDLALLYIALFVPLYLYSFFRWKPNPESENTDSQPMWLTMKRRLWVFFLFLLIGFLNFLATFLYNGEGLSSMRTNISVAIVVLSSIIVSTSIIAGFLMLFRKTDAWVYWVVYSIVNIVLNGLQVNIFSTVLFVIFFIINTEALITWVRMADKKQ